MTLMRSVSKYPTDTFPWSSQRCVLVFPEPHRTARRRPVAAWLPLVLLTAVGFVSGCNNNADVSYNPYSPPHANPPALDSADAGMQWCEDRIYDFDERLELWLY